MAPVGQTSTQGAGLQWRHLFGNEVLYAGPGATWILECGRGVSNTAAAGSWLCECATAQANSHCLQPMHRSGLTKTVFIGRLPGGNPVVFETFSSVFSLAIQH
jgi:hypothetical protein